MALTRPWAIDAAFPNAVDQRRQLGGIYPREGVLPDPVTVAAAGIAYAGTGWGVSARPFVAVLKRGGAPYSGVYGSALISNDAAVANAWTISSAPASGSRIDLLCIRARDTTQGDSATGTPNDGPSGAQRSGYPEFTVVTGTPGTTPVAPALPAGYMEVARIQTPSGAGSTSGSTITQTYPFAFVAGAPMFVRTALDLPAASGFPKGQQAYALDTGAVYTSNGSAWILPAHVTFARSTAYNFTTTKTVLTFGSSPVDGALDGSFSTSDYGTFTCVVPGVYQVAALATVGGAAATAVGLELFKNSAAVRGVNAATNTISWTSLHLAHTLRLAAGDAISLRISSGGTVAAVVSDPSLNNVCIDYVKA